MELSKSNDGIKTAVRALMAGLAFMSSAVAARALEEGSDGSGGRAAVAEEVSLAFPPMLTPTGSAGARPRRPLSSEDAALIRQVIALQTHRSFAEAERLMGAVQSDLLHGNIQAQRLMLADDSSRTDLVAWLDRYGGQADAPEIRRMLAILDHAPVSRGAVGGEAAVPRWDAARTLFTANHDVDAIRVAVSRTRCRASSCFAAGLAAWRAQRYDLANRLFGQAANDPAVDATTQAAALFWSARVLLRERLDISALAQLRRAAANSDSFYGLLAARLLADGGMAVRPGSLLSEGDLDTVEGLPVGKRALALLQVGAADWALAELRHFLADPAQADRPSRAAVRSLALFARALAHEDHDAAIPTRSPTLAAAHLPIKPRGGYTIDPALLYALIRVESNFNPAVVSRSGARGLMQIMPITAAYLLDGPGAKPRRISFDDPDSNLELGQRYVRYLARHETIQGNLLRLLATYNIGGGGFARIETKIKADGDPLLFIEAIPNTETRNFVQRVLAFSWLYALTMHRERPSLDALALGEFPLLDADGLLH